MSFEYAINESYFKKQKEDSDEDFKEFTPKMEEYYKESFLKIVKQALNMLPNQRTAFLELKLNEYSNLNSEDQSIEHLKFLSSLSVLKDLIAQGWRIKIDNDNVLKLAPPKLYKGNNKIYLRQQLQKERNAQLKKNSIKEFVIRMEKKKKFNEKEISIENLIGDNVLLSERIGEIKKAKNYETRLNVLSNAISPYIQLVDNSRCHFTGYKLNDIWRYFRYTWSIPYKSTPGRNLYFLIRDSSQPFHPIIGIFALGNTVLHLTKRDNYIGWTLESIKNRLRKKALIEQYEEIVKGDLNLKRKVKNITLLETDEEYQKRISIESKILLENFKRFIQDEINEINIKDIVTINEALNPTQEVIDRLKNNAAELRKKQLNIKRTSREINWSSESDSPLFKKKRMQQLERLLYSKMIIKKFEQEHNGDETEIIKKLLSYKGGKVANIALQANRKKKIGSNMMEIIVCGAIPPYNEILGGKLVSILAASPNVVKQYNEKYLRQVSEIASRMKGEEVIRDSQLAFLGTTSLYQMGSSQYNRIKIPVKDLNYIEYKKLGETEGFGSVFFTNQTSSLISKMLEKIEGGRRINNVFGEGTSPRLRLMRTGLMAIGISEDFTKHHTKRIVYGIELAKNTKEFLNGTADNLEYYLPLDGKEEQYTENLINYWKERWFLKRIDSVDIISRLDSFDKNSLIVSNFI